MEHIITRRRGFRKLLAFLLCMASILGLLPAQAFAMSVGQTASSWLGDQYVGSDGNHYRAPAPYTYLAYHADGTIDVHTSSGGNAYRHYMLTGSATRFTVWRAGFLTILRKIPMFRKAGPTANT